MYRPAPPALLPFSQRSPLAASVATDAGGLLHHPFTPHSCERVCSLLTSCVTQRLPTTRPTLLFQWVACPSRGRGVGKFLWTRRPSDGVSLAIAAVFSAVLKRHTLVKVERCGRKDLNLHGLNGH